MSVIPKDLETKCVNHFGSDNWFTIKHPDLDYASPYRYLLETKDVARIEQLLAKDIRFTSE